MTNFQSKHVDTLKNKKDCADVYCVTLIELQARRDAFIQNTRTNVYKSNKLTNSAKNHNGQTAVNATLRRQTRS